MADDNDMKSESSEEVGNRKFDSRDRWASGHSSGHAQDTSGFLSGSTHAMGSQLVLRMRSRDAMRERTLLLDCHESVPRR